MLNVATSLLKKRGNRVLHLGGGLGGAPDSLFAFKAGFSKARHPFRTWRVVVDEDRYRELTRAAQPGLAAADVPGFFPAYRRPRDAGLL